MRKPRRTKKQIELMGHILKAANDGEFLNITRLHKLVSYECSYGAIRISVRFLIKQGMIERQPDGGSNLLVPTEQAYIWYRPGT